MLFHALGHLHSEVNTFLEKKKITNSDLETLLATHILPALSH